MATSHLIELAPSILSADFTRLGEQLATVEQAGADIVHVDVMDGHFVPNLTLGPVIVEWVRRATRLPIDTHLMIEDPDKYIGAFAKAGAHMISVHPEATYHLHRTLNYIRQAGCQAGVVLNPATPLSAIEEVLGELDYVLVMSVNPGFGGQKFIPAALNKLRRLRTLLQARRLPVRLEIDGGVTVQNAAEVVAAGAEILVAGSAIFGQPDPAAAVRQLRAAAEAATMPPRQFA
ncbi:MAG: ribulose-phosphate 3-epimerase [Acidobacteria bacterium]|nr:ribulose-phosphate 3-epimerase [Acidobacteriota bacterium]MBI3422121.1 ribulose-phosphate 3-epimerase [Acidobacteriota bacterium]